VLGPRADPVVDYDLRPALRQQQRVRATEPAAGPRHDGDLSVEAHLIHVSLLVAECLPSRCECNRQFL
jgi:hypothetical protein